MKIKFKNDKFKKDRGGYSRLLDIFCENCRKHLFYYQKDGPGILKRIYVDRIYESEKLDPNKNLICPNCKSLLATPMIYEKENRPAFRIFVGAITKKIVKSN